MTDARGLKIKPGDCVIHIQIDHSVYGNLKFANGTIEKIQNGSVYIKKPGFTGGIRDGVPYCQPGLDIKDNEVPAEVKKDFRKLAVDIYKAVLEEVK